MADINKVIVRMYRFGTGDCFALKFYSGNSIIFKMLIDAGVVFPAPSKKKLTPAVNHLIKFFNKKVDVLVITHEHYDHTSVFERCKDIFKKDLTIDKIWMAWTENDDSSDLSKWKEEYNEWKKSVALASYYLEKAKEDGALRQHFAGNKFGDFSLAARERYIGAIKSFSDLNMDNPAKSLGLYDDETDDEAEDKFHSLDESQLEQFAAKGKIDKPLKAMRVIKDEIATGNIEYFSPGDAFTIPAAPGLKFYILGPPKEFDLIWEEDTDEQGEVYEHSRNNDLQGHRAFSNSILNFHKKHKPSSILPFDRKHVVDKDEYTSIVDKYKDGNNDWRKIDYDWLYSSANLSLRLVGMVNNFSLVMAIENENSKEVMLFPGDAEYGSWKSWHDIDWPSTGANDKHLTEDLLNRTIFYKVAHHMSHNGTAKRKGLDMMTDRNLTAMATVDYNKISSSWKNTMPNRHILDELLDKTKGRFFIMNEEGIKYDQHTTLTEKIEAARSTMTDKEKDDLEDNFEKEKLFLEWTIRF